METNNKLREALMQVKELNDLWFDTFTLPDGATSIHDEIENIISAALAVPVKNCEVGTAEEQSQRFDAFCDAHKYVGDDGANWCSRTCPCYNDINCGVNWAQMPYEEGGAE